MPLENQLFKTLMDLVAKHVAATYSAKRGADGKYSCATPALLFSAIERCWAKMPERRVFADIDLWERNPQKIIDLGGKALPSVPRSGHRRYKTVAVRGLLNEDAVHFFDRVRGQIRQGIILPKQDLE